MGLHRPRSCSCAAQIRGRGRDDSLKLCFLHEMGLEWVSGSIRGSEIVTRVLITSFLLPLGSAVMRTSLRGCHRGGGEVVERDEVQTSTTSTTINKVTCVGVSFDLEDFDASSDS